MTNPTLDDKYPQGFTPKGTLLLRVGDHGPCLVCKTDSHWWYGKRGWVCSEACLRRLEGRRSA